LIFFLFKDRANNNNNNNANTSGDELDEELDDFQLPLSLTPRASSTLSHQMASTHMLPQQRSSSTSITIPSSVQHNVVLHSDVNDQLLPATNRFDLNRPLDTEYRTQLNRKTNSLMTVYEHGSTNESTLGELSSPPATYRLRSPSSITDYTYQRGTDVISNTDEKETVNELNLFIY
jgi:hypothetical protein